jgi:multidrug resistance efflux pump
MAPPTPTAKACSTKFMTVDRHELSHDSASEPQAPPALHRTRLPRAAATNETPAAATSLRRDALAQQALLRQRTEPSSAPAADEPPPDAPPFRLDALALQSRLRASFNSSLPPIRRVQSLVSAFAARTTQHAFWRAMVNYAALSFGQLRALGASAAAVIETQTASVERRRVLVRRALKTLACLAVLFGVGWAPTTHYLETASVEAVVNARVVTIRAPIDGEVVREAVPLDVGTAVDAGRVVLRVVNRRADRNVLNELTRRIEILETERAAQAGRLDHLREFHQALSTQAKAYQSGRVRQLEARVAETKSDIAGGEIRSKEATSTLQRASALAQKGFQTPAVLERANRDAVMAAEAETSLRNRLVGLEVELNAAREGVFIGDGYNDQPSSSQRATEARLRIGELESQLGATDLQLIRLKAEQEKETVLYADRAAADLVVPIRGRIWEVLTAPGEEISRGQQLVRVLDCSAAVVTGAVSEKVFNRLKLGDAASFRFANESESFEGKIIHLTGLAAPAENLAIEPSALARDAYRVSIAVPGVKDGCAIGRSGRVVFASSSDRGGVGSRFAAFLGVR